VRAFSATSVQANELANGHYNKFAPLISGLTQGATPQADPVGFVPADGQPRTDLYGGNASVHIALSTDHGDRALHLVSGAMASGFTIHEALAIRSYIYRKNTHHHSWAGLVSKSRAHIYEQLQYSFDPRGGKPWNVWCDFELYGHTGEGGLDYSDRKVRYQPFDDFQSTAGYTFFIVTHNGVLGQIPIGCKPHYPLPNDTPMPTLTAPPPTYDETPPPCWSAGTCWPYNAPPNWSPPSPWPATSPPPDWCAGHQASPLCGGTGAGPTPTDNAGTAPPVDYTPPTPATAAQTEYTDVEDNARMLTQALLLVAVIVMISGSILMSTIVTAKTAFHQALVGESHAAMSDATADFVTWAANRVRAANAEVSWLPIKDSSGRSDTSETKPLCGSTRVASDPSAACTHAMHATWMVTGATTAGGRPPAGGKSPAQETQVDNLARTVDEQRITAIVSVDVQSADGKRTFASESREITARTFDASPYVVVTGVRAASTINGTMHTSEGDSGGYPGIRTNHFDAIRSTPDPRAPAVVTDTRIITDVDCVNSVDFDSNNPYHGDGSHIIQVGRDGDADWAFEMPCLPTYSPTPSPPNIAGYLAPVGNTYATVEDNSTGSFKRAAKGSGFPR